MNDSPQQIFQLQEYKAFIPLFVARIFIVIMIKFSFPSPTEILEIIKRPAANYDSLLPVVREIFEQVKLSGDEALALYTSKFDRVDVKSFKVSEEEIASASQYISETLKSAIDVAFNNITKFHAAQATTISKIETTSGVWCWREQRAIDNVGLYIPGGSAPLFSTVLMLGIPAQVAGCKNVVLCSPPSNNGQIHPAILYAANLCGIHQIFKVGGVQAIAALTYGTTTVPAVMKIFGPGNAYVTVAKQYAQQHGVAIDMPAGPSEVMVIADDTAIADFVAADLLSQAEHGVDSQVILVSTSSKVFDAVLLSIQKQLTILSRKHIAEKALENSKAIVVKSLEDAVEIANQYAAEHLILSVKEPELLLPAIRNAGSIFLGNYTPESCGDYASGTNHTLPTNGFANAYSGVSLDSFLKKITVQSISQAGIRNIAPTVIAMAEAENLDAHANAVRIRLN